ncbi:hypothetical protein AB0N31_10530 [Streptomyces sp. NPDC051051]|uniref:hypothetical protein n=1 Tax=Streptomyces sp. NPDC051051 TaxID=3155666 RepID=UPI00343E2979
MRRTEALQIITRVLKKPVDDVVTADMISGYPAAYFDPQVTERPQPWAIQVDVLAMRIAAQLPLSDDVDQSPLAQAEDAKRRRDLGGEIDALMKAGNALESAPWYPARPGDLVHVHYPAAGDFPAFGETYIVGDAGDGLLSLQPLAHTLPDTVEHAAGMVGCFATEAADEPLYELWFEAGPHLLTIVRDGRPVHTGGTR